MTLEITPQGVAAAFAVLGAAGGYLRSVDMAQERRIEVVKETQKTLFEKLDQIKEEFHRHKTHVAETYANREMLEKLFEPLNRRLEAIERDLRGRHAE